LAVWSSPGFIVAAFIYTASSGPLETARSQTRALAGENETLRSDVQRLQQGYAASKADIGACQKKTGELDSDNEALRVEVQRLREEPEAVRARKELAAVTESLAAANTQVAESGTLKQHLAEAETNQKQVESRLQDTVKQLNDAKVELGALKADRERTAKSVAGYEGQLDDLRSKLTSAQSQMLAKDNEFAALRRKTEDQTKNKALSAANWKKLNGWFAAGRTISRQEVVEVLGNPREVRNGQWGAICSGKKGHFTCLYYGDSGTQGYVCFVPETGEVCDISPPRQGLIE